LIGNLPGTLADRSIHIRLARKLPTDQVERLRLDQMDQFTDIPQQCFRWTRDHLVALQAADPATPAGINDRAADNWRPLLAIAALAGGEWPPLARQAIKLLAEDDDGDDAATIMLLADIRDCFAQRGVDRLPSATLVEDLVKLEDRPWPEWKHGKSLTQNQLARLLRPFKIKPGNLRDASGKVPKGYYLEQFVDVFKRYLPDTYPFQTATPLQRDNHAGLREFQTATRNHHVADQKPPEAAPLLNCSGVADQKPVSTGKGTVADQNTGPACTTAWWFDLKDGSRVGKQFPEPVPLSIAEVAGRRLYGDKFSHAEPQEVRL
jgi:hypothetical protein